MPATPGYRRAASDTRHRDKYADQDWYAFRGRELTHYTSIKGLFGIIESGGFWLSDHRFLNDSEEYHNGRKLVLHIIGRLLDKPRHHLFRNVLDRAVELLENEREPAQYVCAFSTRPDSLDQWRAYAPGEQGVALTFDTEPGAPVSHFIIPPAMGLLRIVYSDDHKAMLLTRTIARFSREYTMDHAAGETPDDAAWARWLASALAMDFITFKHASYESEAEIRMVVTGDGAAHFKAIHHRVTHNKIVPYLISADLYEARLGGQLQLPLKEIRVGPTATQQVTLRSIEEFLKHTGYGHVPVLESAIPFRG